MIFSLYSDLQGYFVGLPYKSISEWLPSYVAVKSWGNMYGVIGIGIAMIIKIN